MGNEDKTKNGENGLENNNPVEPTEPVNPKEGGEGERDEAGKANPADDKIKKLMEEAAREKVNSKKWKEEFDKLASEVAQYKKQIKILEAGDQKNEMEELIKKQEHEEYVKGLEDFKKKAQAKDRYIAFGFSSELAEKAADAEIADDYQALLGVYEENKNEALKTQQEEFLRNRPEPRTGSSKPEEEENPILKGLKSVPILTY